NETWGTTNSKTLEYHFFRYLEVSFLLIPKLGNTKMVIEEAELRVSDSYIPYILEGNN
ncbi:4075_t:CDS:2, partial [Entrophospora sp. SA101]